MDILTDILLVTLTILMVECNISTEKLASVN